MSPLPASLLAADGVIKLKLALPAGLGKISPSMSQKAFRSLYQVSSGTFTRIGLRGYISRSINSHIASDSAIWVSASITPAMILPPTTKFVQTVQIVQAVQTQESSAGACSVSSGELSKHLTYFLKLSINPLFLISSNTP